MKGEITNYFKVLIKLGSEEFNRSVEDWKREFQFDLPKPDLIYKDPQTGEIVELYDPFDPRRYETDTR